MKPRKSSSSGKFVAVILTLIYIACLVYCYIEYLVPLYANLGFHDFGWEDYTPDIHFIAISMIIMIVFLFPKEITRYSDYAALFICYMLYIPIMIYIPMQFRGVDVDSEMPYVFTLSFLAMLLIPRMARTPRNNNYKIRISGNFYPAFFILYSISILYLLYIFRGHITFVSTANVFEHRMAAGSVAAGSYAGYVLGFVAGCFNPFLVAVGLFERKKIYLAIGLAGQLLVYGIAAHKAVLVGTLATIIWYYFFINRKSFAPRHFIFAITTGLALPTTYIMAVGPNILWPMNEVVALIVMRTYGIQAVATGWYYEFFSLNPLTYYSHINIVGKFIDYPYKPYSMGQLIGFERTGNVNFNVTANFWASDGLAAIGSYGVIFVGVIIGILLYLVNSQCTPDKLKVMCTGTTVSLMMLVGSPLTTVLLTGGAGFLFAFLIYWQPDYNENDKVLYHYK